MDGETKKVSMYLFDITYKVVDGSAAMLLFGRTKSGEQICLVDRDFKPYFYAVPDGESVSIKERLKNMTAEKNGQLFSVTQIIEVERRKLGKQIKVFQVFVNLPAAVPLIRAEVAQLKDIKATHDYDIKFAKRYLIDKNIFPLSLVEADIEPETIKLKVPAFRIRDIRPTDEVVKEPDILAFDIETYLPKGRRIDPENNPVLMISFFSKNIRKVITWKRFKTTHKYIEFVESEAELIERAIEVIEKESPDIICGYFSDGFDFPYLQVRASKYKISLDLSLDNTEMKIKRSPTSLTSAEITGMIHLDVINVIRKFLGSNLDTDSYSLNDVAAELLGERKKDVDLDMLSEEWDLASEKLGEFAEYNLRDSELAYKLALKTFPDVTELVRIVGMPVSNITRMGFSQLIEWLLIRNAFEQKEMIPNKPSHDDIRNRRANTYQGGFVFEPTPGLYKKIVIFDYRSLYPTIISSHNISLDTLDCSCCPENKVPDEDYCFCTKKKGFIPKIIEDMITRRMRIKEILREKKDNPLLVARSETLKLLANSFYGYLGFPAARWYSLECARSVTAYARYYIHKAIDEAGKAGFKVIYSDTDSVFLVLEDKTLKDADKFAEEINAKLPGLMELENEGFYPAGLFVSAKGVEAGAKKRYALLTGSGDIKIKGFETIRQNWSSIGKEVQQDVLNIVLKENDAKKALSYVKDVIADIRANKLPVDKMVIFTQLQKDIDDYDSIGPHVKVAMRMKDKGIPVGPGSLIRYVITKGAGKIGDRARLPEEVSDDDYDPEYYINNQVIPSVDRILMVLGYDKDELLESKAQMKLGGFF